MKKRLNLVVIFALIAMLACPLLSLAEEAKTIKTVAVVSLPSYDRVMADFDLIAQIEGQASQRDAIEGMLIFLTGGEGLVGLDKTRPCGVLVATDGKELGACAFVPVTDLDGLMKVASAWHGEMIKNLENGTYEINAKHKRLYVREVHKGWAFVVKNQDHFQYVPANPAKMLKGLNHRYDVAARINVNNMPVECRKQLIAKMAKKLDRMAKHHAKKHKHHGHHKWNPEKMAKACAHMQKMLGDIEHLTIGLSLDNDLEQGIIEVSAVAREGTPAAKHFAKMGRMRTDFGGFQLPDAAIVGRVTTQCAPPPEKQLNAMIERMRKRAYKKIDRKAKSEEQTKVAHKVVDMLLDVAKKTAVEGRNDGALAVSLKSDAMTLIAGRHVADGKKLGDALKLAVKEIRKEHAERVDDILTLNAARYHGVDFHVASLPIPDKCPNKERTAKAVGDRFDVVLGIDKKAVYLAAGRNAMASLKKAIENSAAKRRWAVPPVELTIDLGELAEFVEDFGPPKCRKKADKVDDLLEKAHGQDRIHVIARPIQRGMTLRIELDKGVIRLVRFMKMKPHHH